MGLLDDRLLIRPIEGAIEEPPSWDVMGAPQPIRAQTRLFYDHGGQKMVIMSYELFASAGEDIAERVRADAANAFPGAALTQTDRLVEGLEVVRVVPPALGTSREAVFVLALYVIRADRTVQLVAFYIDPSAAASGGCLDVALRSAQLRPSGQVLALCSSAHRLSWRALAVCR